MNQSEKPNQEDKFEFSHTEKKINQEKEEPNKPLIFFSSMFAIFILSIGDKGASELNEYGFGAHIFAFIGMLVIYPLLVYWFKALWYEVGYKIFNLPAMNFWQAAATSALLILFIGS